MRTNLETLFYLCLPTNRSATLYSHRFRGWQASSQMTTLLNNQDSLSNLQEASGSFKFINRTSRSKNAGKTMYYVNILQVVWGRLILFGVEPRSVFLVKFIYSVLKGVLIGPIWSLWLLDEDSKKAFLFVTSFAYCKFQCIQRLIFCHP